MQSLTHAVYLLVIGILLGGYFVGILASPTAQQRLRQDLNTIAEWLITPRYRQRTAPWRQQITGDPNYVPRHARIDPADALVLQPAPVLRAIGGPVRREITA